MVKLLKNPFSILMLMAFFTQPVLPAETDIKPIILDGIGPYYINNKIEYFFTKNKYLTFDQVLALPQKIFAKNIKNKEHFGVYTESVHWFHFKINNVTPDNEWIFYFDFSNIEEVDLYYKDSKGKTVHKIAGDNIDLNQSEMKMAIPAFRLDETTDTIDYYIRAYNRFEPIYPMRIMKSNDFMQREFREIWMFVILLGISLASLLYNLVVAVISRKVIFIYFAIYIISINIIELDISGMSYLWIYKNASEIGQRLSLISMSVYCASGLKFFQHLYNVGKNRLLISKIINIFLIIQVVVLFHTLLSEFFYGYLVAWLDTAVYGFFVLGGSFYMIRSENRKVAILAIIAWIPLLSAAFWLYGGYLNLVPASQNYNFILYCTVAVEQILFLMLAIFWWKNLSQNLNEMGNQYDVIKMKSSEQKMSHHFMYNSLDLLQRMIGKKDKRVEKTVEDLADIYEYMTYYTEKDMATLRDEWEFSLKYFSVMNKRMGNVAKISAKIQDKLFQVMVPPFVIQPLIEIMLKGISVKNVKKNDQYEIRMYAETIDNYFVLSIDDNGRSRMSKDKSGEILTNIRSRLERYYEKVEIYSFKNKNREFHVKIKFAGLKSLP